MPVLGEEGGDEGADHVELVPDRHAFPRRPQLEVREVLHDHLLPRGLVGVTIGRVGQSQSRRQLHTGFSRHVAGHREEKGRVTAARKGDDARAGLQPCAQQASEDRRRVGADRPDDGGAVDAVQPACGDLER
jgi:hypothetical protein